MSFSGEKSWGLVKDFSAVGRIYFLEPSFSMSDFPPVIGQRGPPIVRPPRVWPKVVQGLLTGIIVGVTGLGLWYLFKSGRKPSASAGASRTAAIPPAVARKHHEALFKAKQSALKSADEEQAERLALINDLIARGVFLKTDYPRVYVGPAFEALTFDKKSLFVGAVWKHYKTANPEAALVSVCDGASGKEIGQYAPSLGGLKMK